MRLLRSIPVVLSVGFASLASIGCDRAPSAAGLKEWTPGDHDGENRATRTAGQSPKGATDPTVTLVETTWTNQCQSCHGPAGHGDGPQGPMVKAPDLSQSKLPDAEIAERILNGKGNMPKFDLPDEIVKGLVVRVRSFRGR